ncbi:MULTISPECIES: WXG100 family type VII secretion target [unclassified Paenibacillus]|uniref:WXG100 family type VII secretion target n=1 Tax=unclassified Paenibacillus TaxID=185978 RepID=UPI0009A8E71C|nr:MULTISPECIES: WXG100 family type VII secretion target [unclassified Paenibacillus]SLK17493.1 WXG100 family type VII secretion target [Paenibacillus sp. RU5A]SOC74806.1 WXG100 family type VII secretion target [Paenibacillus sp. RU26A]SOC76925.1 WXG100 family type VII secretion target [Paenibacillus sp. RU5M]
MSTIKVTPEQLHHVSNQVDQAREQLEHIRGDLTRQIMFIQTMWMGATQERFYYEFEQSRPILDKALGSMVNTSKELKDIATRFQEADAQLVSLGGATGAVGAAAMMTKSSGDSNSGDKGYRMAQVNMFGKWVWMPVNENGDADQAALQAYEKDQGHLDINRMQGVKVEPPGEDIISLQIKAFHNGIHPYTGEPVSDSYARTMVTSLKFAQVFMAIQMVRGSFPGGKGPFRLPSSSPAVAKIKKHIEAAKAKSDKAQTVALGNTQKITNSGTLVKEKSKTTYINLTGAELTWVGQHPKNINRDVDNFLVSSNIGKATEAKVANFVRDETEIIGFGLKILKKDGQPAGDLDVVTKDVIIEVKASIKAVDSEQFLKMTQHDHPDFFNPENKKVVLYIDKPLNKLRDEHKSMLQDIESYGVTLVNSLEKLKEVIK